MRQLCGVQGLCTCSQSSSPPRVPPGRSSAATSGVELQRSQILSHLWCVSNMSETVCYDHLCPEYSAVLKSPWAMILNRSSAQRNVSVSRAAFWGWLPLLCTVSPLKVQKSRFIAAYVPLRSAAGFSHTIRNIIATLIFKRRCLSWVFPVSDTN